MGRSGTAGIGSQPGTTPIGDRPGTAGVAASGWNTAMGRAHVFALVAFGFVVFFHVASENRFA